MGVASKGSSRADESLALGTYGNIWEQRRTCVSRGVLSSRGMLERDKRQRGSERARASNPNEWLPNLWELLHQPRVYGSVSCCYLPLCKFLYPLGTAAICSRKLWSYSSGEFSQARCVSAFSLMFFLCSAPEVGWILSHSFGIFLDYTCRGRKAASSRVQVVICCCMSG